MSDIKYDEGSRLGQPYDPSLPSLRLKPVPYKAPPQRPPPQLCAHEYVYTCQCGASYSCTKCGYGSGHAPCPPIDPATYPLMYN